MLSGDEIKRRGIVSDYIGDIQFQPAGFDLSVRKVFAFNGGGVIDFDNSRRMIPDVKEIVLSDEPTHLSQGVYKVVVNEYVKIPPDVVGLCYPRSSLLRSGATVNCAVWDPGYEGRSSFVLNVMNKNGISITRNARIAQMVFVEMKDKPGRLYDGVYNREDI